MTLPINQIIQGDCAEVMKSFPDNCIDLTVTSPPYDNLREYKGYSFDFETIANELYRVTAKGGVLVWVVGDQIIDGSDGGSTESGTSRKHCQYFETLGFNVHQTIIYEKECYMNSDSVRYARTWEYMFIFAKGRPKTINLLMDRLTKNRGRVYQSHFRDDDGEVKYTKKRKVKPWGKRGSIWSYGTGLNGSSTDEVAFDHPAIFPEELVEDNIKSWSNEGDVILDPFAGSGTTLKMAEKLGRKWIGIEISSEYIEIVKKRLDPLVNNARLL